MMAQNRASAIRIIVAGRFEAGCARTFGDTAKSLASICVKNEWLMANLKQRMLVPGGTSPFDVPSYYYWQQRPF